MVKLVSQRGNTHVVWHSALPGFIPVMGGQQLEAAVGQRHLDLHWNGFCI